MFYSCPKEAMYSALFLGLQCLSCAKVFFKLPFKNSLRNVITWAVDICDPFTTVESIN